MQDLDPEKRKLIYYGLAGFAITFTLFRGCAVSEQERAMKYINFHQDSFIKLCSDNYDELVDEARRECDRFFKANRVDSF